MSLFKQTRIFDGVYTLLRQGLEEKNFFVGKPARLAMPEHDPADDFFAPQHWQCQDGTDVLDLGQITNLVNRILHYIRDLNRSPF